ncbi:hypothetical protein L202_01537 [Cryptococcus amylolentus CBS 6039]|uniref:Uncharacterized protein n=2 Tax=Cryptococcus amylolentus TaxID=104669 RepID=A0A1E3I404_9TREE|nr:hypothetical protein L202_01537 [Cryptococcus amylolentus CBS 6039]ODN83393.1 hypothetical protein L202_01537 [Cryptococcus amylolentus CBS 6039]ODO10922.1 hypothetical protein I350_01521 [Cryptococcus amylolentus CBS 6273]
MPFRFGSKSKNCQHQASTVFAKAAHPTADHPRSSQNSPAGGPQDSHADDYNTGSEKGSEHGGHEGDHRRVGAGGGQCSGEQQVGAGREQRPQGGTEHAGKSGHARQHANPSRSRTPSPPPLRPTQGELAMSSEDKFKAAHRRELLAMREIGRLEVKEQQAADAAAVQRYDTAAKKWRWLRAKKGAEFLREQAKREELEGLGEFVQ